jgi:hypothetical protein
MFTTSVLLFTTVLLVLAAAAARGLFHIDEILEVVEPGEPDATLPHPMDRVES